MEKAEAARILKGKGHWEVNVNPHWPDDLFNLKFTIEGTHRPEDVSKALEALTGESLWRKNINKDSTFTRILKWMGIQNTEFGASGIIDYNKAKTLLDAGIFSGDEYKDIREAIKTREGKRNKAIQELNEGKDGWLLVKAADLGLEDIRPDTPYAYVRNKESYLSPEDDKTSKLKQLLSVLDIFPSESSKLITDDTFLSKGEYHIMLIDDYDDSREIEKLGLKLTTKEEYARTAPSSQDRSTGAAATVDDWVDDLEDLDDDLRPRSATRPVPPADVVNPPITPPPAPPPPAPTGALAEAIERGKAAEPAELDDEEKKLLGQLRFKAKGAKTITIGKKKDAANANIQIDLSYNDSNINKLIPAIAKATGIDVQNISYDLLGTADKLKISVESLDKAGNAAGKLTTQIKNSQKFNTENNSEIMRDAMNTEKTIATESAIKKDWAPLLASVKNLKGRSSGKPAFNVSIKEDNGKSKGVIEIDLSKVEFQLEEGKFKLVSESAQDGMPERMARYNQKVLNTFRKALTESAGVEITSGAVQYDPDTRKFQMSFDDVKKAGAAFGKLMGEREKCLGPQVAKAEARDARESSIDLEM